MPSIIFMIVLLAIFNAPLIYSIYQLYRQKRDYLAKGHYPFTDMPLRPPGEELRLKIQELEDKLLDAYLAIASLSLACSIITLSAIKSQGFLAVIVIVVLLYAFSWRFTRRMLNLMEELRNKRLGYLGERVVGETINQLLAHGFKVFHDLPLDGFNVDHVVVGSQGLFAIETKTVRRPNTPRGHPDHIANYDGKVLTFPFGRDRYYKIEEAKSRADGLSRWLTQSTGKPFYAQSILALPDWYVKRTGVSDVTVLNPKEIVIWLQNCPKKLSADQIQTIVLALNLKCRLPKPH